MANAFLRFTTVDVCLRVGMREERESESESERGKRWRRENESKKEKGKRWMTYLILRAYALASARVVSCPATT